MLPLVTSPMSPMLPLVTLASCVLTSEALSLTQVSVPPFGLGGDKADLGCEYDTQVFGTLNFLGLLLASKATFVCDCNISISMYRVIRCIVLSGTRAD